MLYSRAMLESSQDEQSTIFPRTDEASPPAQPSSSPTLPPPGATLHPWVTIVCTIVVAVMLVNFLVFSGASRVELLERPEDSLERLVTREMDFCAAVNGLPGWQRDLALFILGDEQTLQHSLRWSDQLAAQESASDQTQLERIILMAEAGQMDRVNTAIVPWEFKGEDQARMLEWVRAAYLRAPDRPSGETMIAQVRETLPQNWFADTLVARIAAAIGDRAEQSVAEASIVQRGEVLLHRRMVLAIFELILLVFAAFSLGTILAHRENVRIGEAPLPPFWTLPDGYGLFIRGVLGFLVISTAVSLYWPQETPLAALMTLLAGAPLLWWMRKYVTAHGWSLREVFGLQWPSGGFRQVWKVVLVLVGLSVAGEFVMSVIVSVSNIPTDWTDGLLEDMLWGPTWIVASEAFDSIVWAPLIEEMAFRGVLYGTLRTKMGMWPAVFVSAAVFGFAHGYGIIGFGSVFWSGILWAVAYERTHSLIPGMLAHAVNNFLVTAGFLWIFR